MAITSAIGLDCDVCMGRFLPSRVSLSVSTFHLREKWKLSPEFDKIFDLTNATGTPVILNTISNEYIEGLPVDVELAKFIVATMLEFHEEDYKKLFGVGPTPPALGRLAEYGVYPSIVLKRIFDFLGKHIFTKEYFEREVKADMKAFDKISKVLAGGFPKL